MQNSLVRVLLTIIGIIAIVLITSHLFWRIKPSNELQLFVMNKTVSEHSIKHKSLFWLLNNEKYQRSDHDKKFYDYRKDYYGFLPVKPYKQKDYTIRRVSIQEVDSIASRYQGGYYIDTYGFSFEDWYGDKNKKHLKLYGGLKQNDYLLFKLFYDQKKLLLAEYSFIDNTTSSLIRYKVEQITGIQSTGWIARYFKELDPLRNEEITPEIISIYETRKNEKWKLSGPGFILMKRTLEKIIVIPFDQDVENVVSLIASENMQSHFNVPEKDAFLDWVEFVNTNSKNEVLANFHLANHPQLKSVLDSLNLPSTYPAVLKCKDRPFYYFACEFSSYQPNIITSKFEGARFIQRYLETRKLNTANKFYWDFYQPVVSGILKDYRSSY